MSSLYLDTSVFGGYFNPKFELWTKILSDKAIELAGQYLNENVVGKSNISDCIHIALATLSCLCLVLM